jgi:hypothetical protein
LGWGEVHALVAVRPRKHPSAVRTPLASRRRGRVWLKLTVRSVAAGCTLAVISAGLSVAPVLNRPQASLAAPARITGVGSGSTAAACSASFDVFSASRSLLSRCGIVAYPAQRTGATSGGGRTYSYDVAGVVVTYDAPPPSFDPLTASSGLLASYGIPGPPAGAASRAAWTLQMKKLHFVSPPPFLVALSSQATTTTSPEGPGTTSPGAPSTTSPGAPSTTSPGAPSTTSPGAPSITPDYSDHWAGYVAYGGSFRKVSSTWIQPSLGPTRCHPNSLTIWAGLGGYESAALAQDGTAENTPAIADNQAWWELTPRGMVPVPLYATVGSAFTAAVTYLGGAKFAFFMENDRTGAAWSQTETSSGGADLTTAESIAERPCLARCYGDHATYANLSNFGTVVFKASFADGKPIGSYATYQENMDDTGAPFGHDLAHPGSLSAHSTSFIVKQQSCH